MSGTSIWMYNAEGFKTKQHVFYSKDHQTAACGTMLAWFGNEKWESKPEELKRRKKCKRCVKLIAENLIPAPPPPPVSLLYKPLSHDHHLLGVSGRVLWQGGSQRAELTYEIRGLIGE